MFFNVLQSYAKVSVSSLISVNISINIYVLFVNRFGSRIAAAWGSSANAMVDLPMTTTSPTPLHHSTDHAPQQADREIQQMRAEWNAQREHSHFLACLWTWIHNTSAPRRTSWNFPSARDIRVSFPSARDIRVSFLRLRVCRCWSTANSNSIMPWMWRGSWSIKDIIIPTSLLLATNRHPSSPSRISLRKQWGLQTLQPPMLFSNQAYFAPKIHRGWTLIWWTVLEETAKEILWITRYAFKHL